MVKEQATIKNQKGLHARAAAQVVKLAESFQATTYICYHDMRVSTQSIMGLLMLGATKGSVVLIEGEGFDADQAISAIVQLIDNKFGEG